MERETGTRFTGMMMIRLRRKRMAMERNAAEHAAYFARLRLIGQRLVSTREAAEIAQVSDRTIRTWAQRGVLASQKDDRGHNWYREGDVMAAEIRARCAPRATAPRTRTR
ncbi:MAG TPA: MerR family transcriptional regulator [Mycobacteriales bacterium]